MTRLTSAGSTVSTPAVVAVPVAAICALALAFALQLVDPDPMYWNWTAGAVGNGAGTAVFGVTEPMIVPPPPLGPKLLLSDIGKAAAEAGVPAAASTVAVTAIEASTVFTHGDMTTQSSCGSLRRQGATRQRNVQVGPELRRTSNRSFSRGLGAR
ncbi:hypothetical protein [Actinoplanes aureus]|uniref:Uncharacterized protein n=1 Tax=Actinoplanes aureus TaxID=2792083 RepID=A0A931C377_9ACTN|nr:hypothetical protein [Actinoplanes aureus]MBG0562550.1 hypothetical protein [Actinoplanes aureus]